MERPVERIWYLVQVITPPPGNDVKVNIQRVTEVGEVERVRQATRILSRWFPLSPFYRLSLAHTQVIDTFAECTPKGVVGPVNGQVTFVRIQTVVLGWLNQFRAFEDHTAHFISSEYGEACGLLSKFSELRALEYDRNASFRFVGKFRNYCQHVADPVSISHKAWAAEDGTAQHALNVMFDPEVLLLSKRSWNARVRADLEALEGPMDVLPVLQSAFESCERIYVAMIGEVRAEIDNALAVIRSYQVDDPRVMVSFLEVDNRVGFIRSDMKMEGIQFELASHACHILDQINERPA